MRKPKKECKRCGRETRRYRHHSWKDLGICPQCWETTQYNVMVIKNNEIADKILPHKRNSNDVDQYWDTLTSKAIATDPPKFP